ncbi:MAG: 4Fe-4S dicluster domain-containing protein [Desulfobacteraceae bacterium]|nr:4Fe-4S dicluster domain-containing protein [Desulfobacteraceae bacterium]
MVFTVLLYASLTIFVLGLGYKAGTWFTRETGLTSGHYSPSKRLFSALAGIVSAIFSFKVIKLIEVFCLDILLQRKILKESISRWAMHMLIFWGFILLLLMHALGQIITASLFSGYEPTLNPYFFLRDLFGVIVLAGVVIACVRRFILKIPRLVTTGMDKYAIIMVAVIILSGFFLEGLKITSKTEFSNMVNNYAGLQGEQARALEAYWASENGLVSKEVNPPFEKDMLEQGEMLHQSYCAYCHSPAKSAFASFSVAKIISPVAAPLDRAGFVTIFWYLHFISCFAGLAYLPFSKMLHIFSTPASLLANAVMDEEKSKPENIATRQVMELDACTHCCTCSLYCSAMMGYEAKGNSYILPSEKIAPLKALAAGKNLDESETRAILEGIYLCTNCDRCTVVCPSGINLRQLWFNAREKLLGQGPVEPLILSQLSFARGLRRGQVPEETYFIPLEKAENAVSKKFKPLLESGRPIDLNISGSQKESSLILETTFSYCFGCQNCTTVCPVVGNYENPGEELGLLPHQIMSCLGLGLTETALGAKMLWDCLTCYQCQEHCPQKVKVTDILYELKYMAVKNMDKEVVENDYQAGGLK